MTDIFMPTVIPAKAGIQTIYNAPTHNQRLMPPYFGDLAEWLVFHQWDNTPTWFCPLRGDCMTSWISAFAGMTERWVSLVIALVSNIVFNCGNLNNYRSAYAEVEA